MSEFTWIDELMVDIDRRIEACGMCVQYVVGLNAAQSWGYTIGLLDQSRPELVVLGACADVGYAILDEVNQRLGEGEPVDDARYRLVPVPDRHWESGSELLNACIAYYASRGGPAIPPRAEQVLWADAAGHFPGDPRVDPAVARAQPVLAHQPERPWPWLRPNLAQRRAQAGRWAQSQGLVCRTGRTGTGSRRRAPRADR
jgi:hypothetical protein